MADEQVADVQAREVVLRAIVIRADGRVENAGVISAAYANPLRQLWWLVWGKPAARRRALRINRAHAARQRHAG